MLNNNQEIKGVGSSSLSQNGHASQKLNWQQIGINNDYQDVATGPYSNIVKRPSGIYIWGRFNETVISVPTMINLINSLMI